jgi:hypothetical protein
LYIATCNDYVQVFKQTTLYYHFKKGAPLGQGLDRNEFLLCKITQFGDSNQLEDAILKYALGSSFITKITHMEREEIFGSCKRKPNLLP